MRRILHIEKSLICLLVFVIFTNTVQLHAQGSGYAIEFDGIDDYVVIPSSTGDELNPQNAITIESWIYLSEPASATHRPHYLGKSSSYQLIIETNGLPRFFVRENGTWIATMGTTPIETGAWYHIAGTFDGSFIRLYINGKLEGSPNAMSPPLEQNSNEVRFGNRLGGIEALAGQMDEIRIWDIAKTETELQNGMNMKMTGNESNLVGYWRLDDGSGTTASDLTTNGNNGTLTNMDATSDWITSLAPIGDASIFAESTNISETLNCEVDVVFGSDPDSPGPGYSLAAIQVNESPNDIAGLDHSVADRYWEIWSEDNDFDNNFTATVHFHYDNISGITDETNLVLYRRDSANAAAWTSLTGYSIVSNDGGSSTTTDGIGYIQMEITEVTQGGFSGQYIIGWNIPPLANDDPTSTGEDTPVIIDVLANDSDSDGVLVPASVTITADPAHGSITNINNTTGAITYSPSLNYSGTDQFSYTVNDDGGDTSNSALVNLTINPANDLPVVTDIPDQTVSEGETFATISLDDYVSDVEDTVADISWSWSGNTDLTVTIDGDRIATISIPEENWNGSETITFTAIDLDGGEDSDAATFSVTGINDLPVVTDIPDQTVSEGETFTTISLDDYVLDVEDTVADITWSWSGNVDLTVSVDGDRVATIGIPDENWFGLETITFTATDQDGGQDSDSAVFMVTGINDLPVVADIPDQTVAEGEVFATINLDDYVSDVEDSVADIVWSWSGNTELTVSIDGDRIVTIGIPDESWNGIETIIFTATDQEAGEDSDTATFTVTGINDPPIVADIPDQTIAEGDIFTSISLDDFVEDIEDSDAEIIWTWSGNVDLAVTLDDNRIATIGIPNNDWNGVETITFTATDQNGESANDTATFTVTPVNDAPIVITHIPDTSGATLEEFIFQFDSLTFSDVEGDTLTYSAALETGNLPVWLSFDDATRTFSGTPASEDAGLYAVVVTAFDQDMESIADTFEIHIIRGPLGIVDLAEQWDLNVYPNPNTGNFYVSMNLRENEDVELKIFTATGQLVRDERYQQQYGKVRLNVDLIDFKRGLYNIRILTNSGVASKQIILH